MKVIILLASVLGVVTNAQSLSMSLPGVELGSMSMEGIEFGTFATAAKSSKSPAAAKAAKGGKGGKAASPTCGKTGEDCAGASDCCSGFCEDQVGLRKICLCIPDNQARVCTFNAQCCSGKCITGMCKS
jgi:hypothetical protein